MPSLAEWEKVVRESPYQARVFGPPNWLVAQKAGPDPSPEKLAAVHSQLRAQYGLDEPVPRRERGPHPAEHVEGECEYCCGHDPWPAGREAVQPGRVVPTIVPATAVSPQNVPALCERCGKNEKEGRHPVCAGCRKAAYREGKA